MSGDMEISLDKLPIKRLEHIEESGVEHFPPEIGYEEKTVNLIRKVDFAWAVERDEKKQKKAKEASGPSTWQGLVENLQLAHQELSVIIDLINTVEANDAVTVAGMNRPKSLPNEVLSDVAVSMSTKLQCYRHLSKYFKQSAKALEQQIARESRFYGALIRLQQNWKVKRHRMAANTSGSEGFLIDLSDNSMRHQEAVIRPPAFSMVRVDHDSSGMLAVNMPKNSSRAFNFGFLGDSMGDVPEKHRVTESHAAESPKETKNDSVSDDDCIRETHTALRNAHRAIFYEQVFELVSRESFNPSLGVNVTGIREDYLELNITPGVSAFLSLEPYKKEDVTLDNKDSDSVEEIAQDSCLVEWKKDGLTKSGCPNRITYQIYLQQLFHDDIFAKEKDRSTFPGRTQSSSQTKNAEGLVSHFCLSLSHRIFSSKVQKELENLVIKVPYLQLITLPTWHSRTSSWTLCVKVPQAILNTRLQALRSDDDLVRSVSKSLFQTNVVVKDDYISIEGGGAPNAVGLFKSNNLEAVGSKHRFSCDLVDLPMVLLLQVASQIIQWLHEEALMVGIKTNRDFLSLSLELDQGERLSLVAHVDRDDALGCISWWLTLEDGFTKEHKLQADLPENECASRQFLGYLSLDALYSALMDFLSLCNSGANH